MKASELRNMTVEQLKEKLAQFQLDEFTTRYEHTTNPNQGGKTHLIRVNRRNIARVMTVLSEKLRSQGQQ